MRRGLLLATVWRAISQASDGGLGALLEALAKVSGALAARLYVPDGGGDHVFAAEWCWALAEGEARSLALPLDMDGEGLFVLKGGAHGLPLAHPAPWALLPLPHNGRIVAWVVLACPALPDAPDVPLREALVLAARQAGAHIAALRALSAVEDAGRMRAFHQSLAFATHDIKGIASQMALLASNAERLGNNPDFRADMVITLRVATARLDALLARLAGGEGAMAASAPDPADGGADLGDMARAIAQRLAHRHRVTVIEREACAVLGKASGVEQVLTHLIDNAVEASPSHAPVFVAINDDGAMARVEIIDSGHGMSPQFLAEHLFRPFDTAKPGGFGLGAFEAREMVRMMGGRLDVESHEGVGTRFVIRLPLAAKRARAAL